MKSQLKQGFLFYWIVEQLRGHFFYTISNSASGKRSENLVKINWDGDGWPFTLFNIERDAIRPTTVNEDSIGQMQLLASI